MQKAFSLVELSIVLVILGLLTGGILAGQSLVRASELRSISTDFTRYATALHAFRDKYFQLPGDMGNATKFWGSFNDGGGSCPHTPGSGSQTCDGDGNNRIEWIGPGGAGYPPSHEMFTAWQHLANAGLIEGKYSGISSTTGAATGNLNAWWHQFGVNVPASRISSTGYGLQYLGDILPADVLFFATSYGNVIYFGKSNANTRPVNGALIPVDAWNIDTKMDDGRSDNGKLMTKKTSDCLMNTSNPGNFSYRLDSNYQDCAFIFKTGL